jgi:RIO kinase 1
MYEKAEIVHADLSQYNIIIHKNKPFIIDVGQAVIIKHPMAYDFLKRDIINITNYFKKYNIRAEPEKIYNDIVNK